MQKLYRITCIFWNHMWSFFIHPFDINLLAPRGTLGLQRLCRAQLFNLAIRLHCCLLWNYVISLLTHSRGWSRTFLQTQSFFILPTQKKWFWSSEKQDQGVRSCLTSKGLAKPLPRMQNLNQITYILCNTVSPISTETFDTKWLAPRGTLALQCILRAQPLIHTKHLPCSLSCNYVRSHLAYCRG